jgi:hypothetical protein
MAGSMEGRAIASLPIGRAAKKTALAGGKVVHLFFDPDRHKALESAALQA